MKKTVLFLIVLLVSVYAVGQKFQAVSVSQPNSGIPATTLTDNMGGPGVIQANPQTDYLATWACPSNGSTSANTRCPGNTINYQRTEYLITAAEMATSGFPVGYEINSIGWLLSAGGGTSQTGTLNVYLKNTTDATYTLGTAWTTTDFTLVNSNPAWTVPIAAGAYEVPFTGGSTFTYTGGGVYVAWEFSNPGTVGATAVTAYCNTTLTSGLMGNRSTSALPTTLAASSYRPATSFGNNFYTDILSVTNIYTLERAPIPFGAPVPISVRVVNTSTSAATFDVTITVKDATNTIVRHTATYTVNALPASYAAIISFTWTPTILEDVNITATASPASGENFLSNNTMSMVGNVNDNLYSYNYNVLNPPGAVGWTAPYAAIFASRFQMTGSGIVTGANIVIGTDATATGHTVYAVVLNKQGNVVAQSANHVILAAELGTNVNFPFPTPPSIGPEEFYVGLATETAATTYYPMGYFSESPTRENTFYRFELSGSAPAAISGYKFGIEAQVAPFTGVVYPRNFTAAASSSTQIDLSWLQNANGNPVMVAVNSTNSFGTPTDGTSYPVSSVLPGGGTIIYNASGTSFNNTGLSPSTNYYYKAWSVDGSTVYSSGVTASEATYFAVPYTQNFEVTTPLPPSWSGTMSVVALHGTSLSSGITFDLFDDPDYHSCTAVSPHIVLSANTCKAKFDYRITDWVSGTYPGPATVLAAGDKAELQVSTNNGSSWTTVYLIDQANHVASQNFAAVEVPLTGYTGACMFRILGTWGAGDHYLDIDNFIVEEIPLCPAPTALTVNNITTSSAMIGWSGPAAVEIDYGLTGHTAGTGTIVTPVVNNPYTLTPLASGTGYDVYVRQECSPGLYSAWTGPLSFTTLQIIGVTPIPFNFGTVPINGASASQEFTIKNNGTATITIESVVLGGTDPTQFTLTDGSTYPKNLAASASYTVSVVFNPTSVGVKNAKLLVSEPETAPYEFAISGTCACPAPSALTATNIAITSADLGWTANGTTAWEIEWGLSGFTQGTGTMITTGVTNPYTLSGLTGGHTYSYYVRGHCGGNDYSTWTGPYSFTTLCPVYTAPFVEGFESTAFPPICWSITTGSQLWAKSTLASGYGVGTASARAYFFNYSSATPFDLMTFGFNSSGLTKPALNFDYAYATYSNEVDEMDIYYSTDAGLTYSLLLAMPGGPAGSVLNTGGVTTSSFTPTANQWKTKIIILPAGTNKIKFSAISAYGNNLYLDNVAVQEAPACSVPTSVVATAIAQTTATISWTASISAPSGGYQYEIRTSGDAGSGATGLAVSGSTLAGVVTANITGLTSYTNYFVYVRSDCGSGIYSPWTTPITFATLCDPSSIPYVENFDAYTIPSTGCVTVTNDNGDGHIWFTTDYQPKSSPNSMVITYNSSMDMNDWFFTPGLNLVAGKTYDVKFWYAGDGTYPEKLAVKWGTAPNAAGMTGGQIFDNSDILNAAYVEGTGRFTVATTGIYYVGWHGYSDADNDLLFVDDLSVTEVPPCLIPTTLTATNITAYTADLGWTETGTATSWDLEWGPAGFTPGSGTTIIGVTNPYALTGLTESTNYEFRVRANCGSANFSEWTSMFAFATISSIPFNNAVENVTVTSTACFNATNFITVAGGTTYFTVSSTGDATFIAGVKINFLAGTTVASGGHMLGKIYTGTWCGSKSATIPEVNGQVDPTPLSLEQAFFSLYPNPTNGNFTIVQKGDRQYGNVKVEVYGMRGEKILSTQMVGEKMHEFATSTLPAGLYFVKVVADNYTETIKLIKTR